MHMLIDIHINILLNMYVNLICSVYDNTFSPLIFIFTSFPIVFRCILNFCSFQYHGPLFLVIPAILLLLLMLSLVMLLHLYVPWGLYLIYKHPCLPFNFLQASSFCFLYRIIFIYCSINATFVNLVMTQNRRFLNFSSRSWGKLFSQTISPLHLKCYE